MNNVRPVSIRQVAKAAGVSPTTVSRVFSENPIPTASTREKVMAVARDLGYPRTRGLSPRKPSEARPVARRKANVVAIVSTPAYPGSMDHGGYHGRFMKGLHKVLDPHGCHLVWGGSIAQDGGLPDSVDLDRVDGVIIEGDMDVALRDYLCQKLPVVFSSSFPSTKVLADVVGLDIEHCIVDLVDYLAARGREHPALMVQLASSPFYDHYSRYLGKTFPSDIYQLSAPLDLHDDNYEAVIDDYIARLKQCRCVPTCILCAYRYAPVLVGRLQMMGLRVPEDVGVISLAERELQLVTPSLTCYAWCRESIGVMAAELLLSRIEDPDRVYRRVLMRGGITERDSCAVNV